jgi:hypothetical protein
LCSAEDPRRAANTFGYSTAAAGNSTAISGTEFTFRLSSYLPADSTGKYLFRMESHEPRPAGGKYRDDDK